MLGHNSDHYDALVRDGDARIEWVDRYSPVLNGLVKQSLSDGSLRGKKIAVVVHLEAKTAFLALVLANAGAEVIVAGSNPRNYPGIDCGGVAGTRFDRYGGGGRHDGQLGKRVARRSGSCARVHH